MKQKGNVIIILVIIVILVAGIILSFKSKSPLTQSSPQPTATSTSVQTKNFQSKSLKFSIDIPPNLEVEERITNVIFKQATMELKIARNGTNFEELDDFLKDLATKNKMTISNKESLNINGLTAVKGTVKFPGGPTTGELTYYIKTDFAVYIISTANQPLFDDLDQIAQSFRYTP